MRRSAVVHPHLELENVTKRFGAFKAVDDVSFCLNPGEIIGFLGPNGAGKSTSLRVALGIMAPDQGRAQLFGESPNLTNLRRVGFLPEERGLYKRMSARNTIAYFAQLKGMKRGDALVRADELLESFGLSEFRKERISRLSKGMAQKVQILSTLAHSPDILILDEPFSGLDPVNQADLEVLIRKENERGATILFSTHVMEHAERLCDRLVLIAEGHKMFDGTLQEAFATQDQRVRLAVPNDQDVVSLLGGSAFDVRPLPEQDEGTERNWFEIGLPQGASSQDVLKVAIERGLSIEGFDPGEQRLRDVFVSLVAEAKDKFGASRHA